MDGDVLGGVYAAAPRGFSHGADGGEGEAGWVGSGQCSVSLSVRSAELRGSAASLISVMPERLLDPLTRQEIADLFAYMESDPNKK